jgi:DNA processing protein
MVNRSGNADEQAAVLALVGATEHEWYRTADLIEQADGAVRLLERRWNGLEPLDRELAEKLAGRVTDREIAQSHQLLQELSRQGVYVATVLDEAYPRNLRYVYNRPPVLFIRGKLLSEDDRALAVVGTRSPSQAGLDQTQQLAAGLAKHGVTVLSGLALGVDSAAHTAALDANGRTIAVMGTGINRIYPPGHETLADRIAEQGALVSQFWPDAPPTKFSFPMRNVVMSGMAIGTVVVEATSVSGARNQARMALEHGKKLFLVESLVLKQSWARSYAQRPGTTVIRSVSELLKAIPREFERPAKQLAFR